MKYLVIDLFIWCLFFPSCNNNNHYGYIKYTSDPVYGDQTTGTIFDPYVTIQHDSLIMSVSERTTGNIIRLSSIDGIHWKKTNTMLTCRPNTWEHIVNRSCILYTDTIWHMWYTGQSPEIAWIGHATSLDGYEYERDTNPALLPTLEYEGVSVMNPCVIYNKYKECFQMWYAAGENYEPDAIFYAESDDALHWKKLNKPVLTKYQKHLWEQAKVGGCDVKIINDSTYLMYYIGYKNINSANICYAISKDGVNWRRPSANLILSPTKGSWDCDAVYKPTFINWKGVDLLWYNGRKGNKEYIGLAKRINHATKSSH